jgi:hypothetical protein
LEPWHQQSKNEVPFRLVWNYVGILAAASFTTTMFTANRVAIEISSAVVYICYWGAVIVFSFSVATQTAPYNFDIFLKWGCLALLAP